VNIAKRARRGNAESRRRTARQRRLHPDVPYSASSFPHAPQRSIFVTARADTGVPHIPEMAIFRNLPWRTPENT
jgi:hypothetical protein